MNPSRQPRQIYPPSVWRTSGGRASAPPHGRRASFSYRLTVLGALVAVLSALMVSTCVVCAAGELGQNYAYTTLQTRYVWQGIVEPERPLHFTQVLLPHSPLQPARELADGIKALLDTPTQTALKAEGIETDARQLYVHVTDNKVTRALVIAGTYVILNGKEILRQAERKDWELGND